MTVLILYEKDNFYAFMLDALGAHTRYPLITDVH